jgi:DNA modification methylase
MQQDSLLDDEKIESSKGPIECLGQTFENEEARREYFTELLSEKLKDSEFRKIEGFPIGTDEAILELSDPPYYTACPNPWLNELVDFWESQKENSEKEYHREPFAADVSEGKNDPIYNAHSYHTKVPHKAIMRYILHYTNPGDIVFDGFCGTGMTGVAAQMCGDRKQVEELGYKINSNGGILKIEKDTENENDTWSEFSKLGKRHCIINDLSPAATFIASNYNSTKKAHISKQTINDIEIVLKEKYQWMFSTINDASEIDEAIRLLKKNNYTELSQLPSFSAVNYIVWSDIFICPSCTSEVNFFEQAVKLGQGIVLTDFECDRCGAWLSKSPKPKKDLTDVRPSSYKVERAWDRFYDIDLNESVKIYKQLPVLVNSAYKGKKFRRPVNAFDKELIKHIKEIKIPYQIPKDKMPKGDKTNDPFAVGIKYSSQFYTKRNLYILSAFWSALPRNEKWAATSFLARNLTKCNRFVVNSHNPNGRINGPLTGTLYMPSEMVEQSIFGLISDKQLSASWDGSENLISTSSITNMDLRNQVDYIFIDPPFGANIMYSELSFLWESWLGVSTNKNLEAIENKSQSKSIDDYRKLMLKSFIACNKLLKPGRWITVEFSNTKASIWNSIQTSLTESGFIIANVSALDKKHGGIKAMTNATNVKQDLVITAYKPEVDFKNRFLSEDSEAATWDFVSTHLSFLPSVKTSKNTTQYIREREGRILYDRMLSFFIKNGKSIYYDIGDFLEGLKIRYPERQGMFFLPEQVTEFDKNAALTGKTLQLSIFVDDEASAIEWLRQELKNKPKKYSDIHPLFLNELSSWKKNELQLELMTLLEQNFIKYDGTENVPNQIHTYLSTNFKDMRGLAKDDTILVAKAKDRWYVPDPSKAGDIEKLRLRALLREFDVYKEENKKIQQPRAEALRAGFSACWENQDLQTILDISAKIPPAVLQEDEKLLMFYDNALTLTSNNVDDWD